MRKIETLLYLITFFIVLTVVSYHGKARAQFGSTNKIINSSTEIELKPANYVELDGYLNILTQQEIRFNDSSGGEYASIKAPATIPSNYVLVLPDTDGTATQILETDGAGILSWVVKPTSYDFTASNDNRLIRSDTVGADQIQESGITVTDANAITGATITAGSNTISGLLHGTEVDNPSSGVHGVVGSVVGTSDIQTLTNKTIAGGSNTISGLTHGTEVDNPSSGVHGVTGSVVGTTDSQTLTNKIISGGSGSGMSMQVPVRSDVKQDTDANLVTYAATATNGQLCFATDTKKLYQVVDSALVEVGAGAGGGGAGDLDNFLTDAGFETGVTEFTSTVGSITQDAVVFKNGANSLDVTSGTTIDIKSCFTSTEWEGRRYEVGCYINSSLNDVELCANNGTTDNACNTSYVGGSGWKYVYERDTVATGADICLRVKSASAGTINLDNCHIGEPKFSTAELSEDTDWISYTPTATQFGTITTALGKWRRVGDSMEVEGSFIVGTPSSSPGASIELPVGYLIDISKISGGSQNILGTYSRVATSVAYYDAGVTNIMFSDAVDQNSLFVSKIATSNGIMQKTAGDGVSGAGMGVVFKFTVPIVGWTSANTNVITPTTSVNISKAVNNATTSMSASTQYHIGFNTAYVGFDIDGNFTNVGAASSTTYTSATYFTSPKTDTYHVKSKVHSTDIDLDAADGLNISIFVNNIEVERKNYKIEGTLASPNRDFVIDEYVKLDKNDIVTIGFYHTSGSGPLALTNGDISSNFTVVKRGSDAEWAGIGIQDVTLSTSSTGDFTGGSIRIVKIFKQVTIEVQSTITHASLSSASSASGFLPVWARPNASVLNSYHAAAAGNIYSINAQADGTLNFTYIDSGTGGSSARVNAGSKATMSYLAD